MSTQEPLPEQNMDAARAAKKKAHGIFSAYGEINGIGLTWVDGRMGIKVNFESPPTADATLPASIDGVPVVVQVGGQIREQRDGS